jgi:hypothetical protein
MGALCSSGRVWNIGFKVMDHMALASHYTSLIRNSSFCKIVSIEFYTREE